MNADLTKRTVGSVCRYVAQIVPLLWISLRYDIFARLAHFFDHEGVIEHRVGKLFARRILQHMRQDITVVGEQNVVGLDYFVVACNHASYLDFAVLLGYFPAPLRFIAKKELRHMPVVGGHLARRGVIIDRKDRRLAFSAIEAAIKDSNRTPILIFPEGTRSDDGLPKRFKRGGLSLAVKNGVPIVPVTLIGTAKHLPRNAINYLPGGHLKMVIAPPETLRAGIDEEAVIDKVEKVIHETFQAESAKNP